MARKIGRNDPCPCNSGRKFKRCCLPNYEAAERMQMEKQQEGLKNTFRDEIKKEGKTPVQLELEAIGEEKMRLRCCYVVMRDLQVQRVIQGNDVAHTKKSIQIYEDFLKELEKLPISEASVGIIGALEKQIEKLTISAKQSGFSSLNKAILYALEQLQLYGQAASSKPPPLELEGNDGTDSDSLEPPDSGDDEGAAELKDDDPPDEVI